MKVRMKQQISGLRAGQRWPKIGEVLDCDEREGTKLCANGYAEPVAETPQQRSEKAVVSPPEKRTTVDCDVDGCDYSGSEQGLKIHQARSHK